MFGNQTKQTETNKTDEERIQPDVTCAARNSENRPEKIRVVKRLH